MKSMCYLNLHQYGAAAWPFHHGEPVPHLPKVYVPPGHRPAVLRQVWGRYEQQLGGLNAGFEAESGYQEHSVLKSYKEQGLPPLEQHVTQQGHGWNSRGHCAELVCNIPSSSHVYMWRRQLGLGKACFSEKVLGPSISHPMSSCISCCSQLVSPRH